MIILHAEDVKKALPMDQTIRAMKSAYAAFSSGKAQVPLRARLDIDAYGGTCLFMPSYVQDESGDALALKAVAVYPKNTHKDLPTIHAAVLVFETQTGRPIALLEGSTLTALRTGAASGAATDLLANPNAQTAAVFGAGVQGRTQLAAICTVRKITTAWVYDLQPNHAAAMVEEMKGHPSIPTDLRVAKDPTEAVRQAEIICTATTSKKPVYPPEAVRPGTHINGVGSYTLEMVENPPEIIHKAALFVDSIEAVTAEAGDFARPLQHKVISQADFREIGQVISGAGAGRTNPHQLTFFKSVGIAIQDAAAARLALENALKMGLGQEVVW